MMHYSFLLVLCGSVSASSIPNLSDLADLAGKFMAFPPKLLGVKDFDKCLQPCASGAFCLPLSKPIDCCEESWNQFCALRDDKLIPSCPRDAAEPAKEAPPRKYLSIKDYEKCLKTCPSGWCRPDQRPLECCEDSWKDLCNLAGNDAVPPCEKPANPPKPPPKPAMPGYLNVKDYDKCLQKCSDGWCLPDKKPVDCCDESWKSVCDLGGSDKVKPCERAAPTPPPLPIQEQPPRPRGPKYLTVKGFDRCLRSCPSGWCKPSKKPDDCRDESWTEICGFTGEDRVQSYEEPRAVIPEPIKQAATPRAGPRRYLSVKDFDKCLQKCESEDGWCKPETRSTECCEESWKELCGYTGADVIPDCKKPPIAKVQLLPPKYLAVKDFNKCVNKQRKSGVSAVCLPTNRPSECCEESWNQICGFAGRDRPEPCAAEPRFLKVKDFDKCLRSCPGGWCKPSKRPDECCEDSWKELCSLSGAEEVIACKD